jgi:hypothetical protein
MDTPSALFAGFLVAIDRRDFIEWRRARQEETRHGEAIHLPMF